MNDIKTILLLGSGGLRVGQAGEFDYSGSQAIKAFKEENIRLILVNPNIATVQTDESMADEIYFVPLQLSYVTQIIKSESIDAIALSFGGQTALNLGLELHKSGILDEYQIRVLGSSIETINQTEDRGLFKNILEQHQIKTPKSQVAYNLEQALFAARTMQYPIMMRAGFSLGGLGSSRINTEQDLIHKAAAALSGSNQILIEEYLINWIEFEYEVVRDQAGSALTICNLENMDPMGIHTGESIVIAPAQTLNDIEHQTLRDIAIKCTEIFNIVGECNVQFAVNPHNFDYRVIEINPRLSRSSALASKATGYQLAYIAAKLCLGYKLQEIHSSMTSINAFFEPALDYVVVKIPRWDTHKLPLAERRLTTEMKSVGEVMAIGRTFYEALQKAISSLNIAAHDLYSSHDNLDITIDQLKHEIEFATDRRIFMLFKWFLIKQSLEDAHNLSGIHYWFLSHIKDLAEFIHYLQDKRLQNSQLDINDIRQAKQFGFSDNTLAQIYECSISHIRELRIQHNILPVVKQIDTSSAEFNINTNYLYMTYNANEHDVMPLNDSISIIGSGPYSIGSSVEFDWCTVNLSRSVRRHSKKQVIVINCNPETVSTDCDESNRLYLEPVTLERVQDILQFETNTEVCLSVGGQIANNMALALYKAGFKILGTSPISIDIAENRAKFSQMLQDNNIKQPRWISVNSIEDARNFIQTVGLPVLIRPSYVLSGSSMRVIFDEQALSDALSNIFMYNSGHSVVISEFIENAKELEIDGIAINGKIIVHAISEHVENAGVHSGDATVIFPAERLYVKTVLATKNIADKIVRCLNISGPFNMQFIARLNNIQVIECNVRASRSLPFISKVIGHNFIDLTAQVLLYPEEKYPTIDTTNIKIIGVKSPVFSYNRFKGSNPVAQVEMSSTGEVACIGDDLLSTFYMSYLSVGNHIKYKTVLLSLNDRFKEKLLPLIQQLSIKDWSFIATEGTHDFLVKHGIQSQCVFNATIERNPNVRDLICNHKVGLIINIPRDVFSCTKQSDGFIVRRLAIDHHIPLVTNCQLAEMLLECLYLYYDQDIIGVRSYNEYINS